MRPVSSNVREFIHLLNKKSVKYLIVGGLGSGVSWSMDSLSAAIFRSKINVRPIAQKTRRYRFTGKNSIVIFTEKPSIEQHPFYGQSASQTTP